MVYLYSPTTRCFYPEALIQDYITNRTLPEDVIKVSEDDFIVYGLGVPPESKQRAFSDGQFYWADVEENLVAKEMAWVEKELERIRDLIERLEDSFSKKSTKNLRIYRNKLKDWASSEYYPDSKYRPVLEE